MTNRRPRRSFPPEVLTPGEVKALLDACHGSRWVNLRDRALIGLLYRTGLRITEALGLYTKDIDATRHAVRVLRGKGGRARTVGIDDGALALLVPWLERRQTMGFDDRHPLFCSAWGNRLDPGQVRRMLHRLGKRAGIPKRVHPHGLRHTLAAELREEGVDIGVISKQLGHSDISTTARYLDHIAPWRVVEIIGQRSWWRPSVQP